LFGPSQKGTICSSEHSWKLQKQLQIIFCNWEMFFSTAN
jgi:hypothetical protein